MYPSIDSVYDADLSEAVTDYAIPYGKEVSAVKYNGADMEFTCENGNISISKTVIESFGTGEKILKVFNADKTVSRIKITVVTKVIKNLDDLKSFRAMAAYTANVTAKKFGGYYVLANDIDANNYNWTPWCADTIP